MGVFDRAAEKSWKTLTILFTPIYPTIAAACVIFLFVSYVIPTALGLFAYDRTWTKMGPWNIGGWYRPVGEKIGIE